MLKQKSSNMNNKLWFNFLVNVSPVKRCFIIMHSAMFGMFRGFKLNILEKVKFSLE